MKGCEEIKDWGSQWYLVIKICSGVWELMARRASRLTGFLVWVSECEESIHLCRAEQTQSSTLAVGS